MKSQKEYKLYKMIAGVPPKLGTLYKEDYVKKKYVVTSVHLVTETTGDDVVVKATGLEVRGVPLSNYSNIYWVKKWVEKDNQARKEKSK